MLVTESLLYLKDWIGRTEDAEETIAPDRVAALAAALDLADAPRAGDALPPGWHWIFFNAAVRGSELGPDGHPRRGGFLPPVPLPRRMWAGGRLSYPGTLRIGDVAHRRSQIASVETKRGRSGELVFVTVKHHIGTAAGAALEEEHDIVYRDAPKPGASPTAQPAPTDGAWHATIDADPVLLFRYSALTFNGHRIHYDWPYATQTEGYPGLVVHAPLISTQILELARRSAPSRRLARYSFRAVSPLFGGASFTVHGRPEGDRQARLWATGPDGAVAMEATAEFE